MGSKIVARYGAMGFLGTFSSNIEGLRRGDQVVLRTDRGTEAGEVVNTAPGPDGQTNGPFDVLRALNDDDRREILRIDGEAVPKEMAFCRERIKALNLPMKLVSAEHLLGGEKIIFYFVAEGRVDFRQLVKDIAREYKTRIELRQIGVRDEARLLSEFGHCGQRLCCRSFMKALEPVTMRMAKSQKATLDPTKISGVCGRLMCCLRYEDRVYTELKAKLPKRGSMVTTRKGSGKVIDMDILAQIVSIRTTDTTVIRVPAGEVLSVEGKPSPEPEDDETGAAEDAVLPPDAAAPRSPNESRQPGQQPGDRRPRNDRQNRNRHDSHRRHNGRQDGRR